MPLGRQDAWGDSGHDIGRLPTAFDKTPPKGDSALIDGRPLSILTRRDARPSAVEEDSTQATTTTPDNR